jgi:transcriptional regulator with XRE-family HTH domain
MELLTREEFNKKIGQRMRELREQMGLSQAEVAERVSQVPVDAEMRMRRLAAVTALVTWLREKRGLSCEQLAKRSEVPVRFVRDLEGLRDFNPDFCFLYRVSHALGLTLSAFMQRVERLARTKLDEHDRPVSRKRDVRGRKGQTGRRSGRRGSEGGPPDGTDRL